MTDESIQKTEIAVVGGGAAGLSAAIVAAEAGAQVTVLEALSMLGGTLGVQAQALQGDGGLFHDQTGIQFAEAMTRAARDAGADLVTGAAIWGLEPSLVLAYTHEGAKRRLKAGRLVVATGGIDGVAAFPGWTLPGVMLLGALQRMLNIHRVIPGNRVLVLGGGDAGVFAALDLLAAGAEVKGIVEPASDLPAHGKNVDVIARTSVPIYTGHRMVRAEGGEQVETAFIGPVAGDGGRNGDKESRIEVDTICLATHRQPRWELAALAGPRSLYSDVLGGFVPVRNIDMRTGREDVFVAGDAAGVENGAMAIMQGRLAGLAAAADLGHRHSRESHIREETLSAIRGLRAGAKGPARREASDRIEAAWAASGGPS